METAPCSPAWFTRRMRRMILCGGVSAAFSIARPLAHIDANRHSCSLASLQSSWPCQGRSSTPATLYQAMPDGTLTKSAGVTAEGWLTDSWYFACASSSLKPGEQFRRIILGQPVMLARTVKGEVFALRDICPHRLVPLSEGRQVDTDGQPTIQCPYHGWRFNTSGQCAHMPSLVKPEDFASDKVRVRRYPVHETNGMVFVYVADNPREDVPALAAPDFGLGAQKPKFIVHQTFNADMDDAVVGLMDPAHVPFVHDQWWWRPPSV